MYMDLKDNYEFIRYMTNGIKQPSEKNIIAYINNKQDIQEDARLFDFLIYGLSHESVKMSADMKRTIMNHYLDKLFTAIIKSKHRVDIGEFLFYAQQEFIKDSQFNYLLPVILWPFIVKHPSKLFFSEDATWKFFSPYLKGENSNDIDFYLRKFNNIPLIMNSIIGIYFCENTIETITKILDFCLYQQIKFGGTKPKYAPQFMDHINIKKCSLQKISLVLSFYTRINQHLYSVRTDNSNINTIYKPPFLIRSVRTVKIIHRFKRSPNSAKLLSELITCSKRLTLKFSHNNVYIIPGKYESYKFPDFPNYFPHANIILMMNKPRVKISDANFAATFLIRAYMLYCYINGNLTSLTIRSELWQKYRYYLPYFIQLELIKVNTAMHSSLIRANRNISSEPDIILIDESIESQRILYRHITEKIASPYIRDIILHIRGIIVNNPILYPICKTYIQSSYPEPGWHTIYTNHLMKLIDQKVMAEKLKLEKI